jgi:SAM-dependent methyltransferase
MDTKNLYMNDARFYDLDNRDVTKVDIPFYLDRASRVKGDILELACGSGRVTIPLARAGHEIRALEYSPAMIEVFKEKIKKLPGEIADRIHLFQGDMSNFSLEKKFPLIILPCRSFQLLLDEELEIACLKKVHAHLAEDGTFIIDIGNFVGTKEKERAWISDVEVFDWENTNPQTDYRIRRTHIKKEIDTDKQIIYPHKTYRITKEDGTEEKIIKRAPWKYFFPDQIRSLITSNRFDIIEEMGSYDGRPINAVTEPEFVFICRKG